MLATSITRIRFSISLIYRIYGSQSLVSSICIVTLNFFLMLIFYLLVVLFICIIYLGLFMRFTPTINPDSMI